MEMRNRSLSVTTAKLAETEFLGLPSWLMGLV
jgi:hypothetical protein